MTPRISAIVLSFNRLELLQRCVTSLRMQSRRPHEILVVDSSTEAGLIAWLAAQSDLTTLRVPNSGSAGSSAAGMQWAVEHGSDWVWLSDDDVIATPDALAVLLGVIAACPDVRVLNSLSLGIQDTTRPATGAICLRTNPDDFFNGQDLYTRDEVAAHADKDGLVDTLRGQLFQGTLIHRSVIERVGVPLPILFTRGDEVEYALRMMRAGYHIYSVPASVVQHPLFALRFIRLFGRAHPAEYVSAIKRYYSIRNSLYIRKAYYGAQPFRRYAARRLVAALLTDLVLDRTKSLQERFESCAAALRGTRDGLRLCRLQN